MTKPFWSFEVRERRELVILRQKARQIAHLLHFPPFGEACVAAGAFAAAAHARERHPAIRVDVALDQRRLVIAPHPADGTAFTPGSLLKLERPLPEAARAFDPDDLGWLIACINDHTRNDVYGEVCRQNQEVLELLHLVAHPAHVAPPHAA